MTNKEMQEKWFRFQNPTCAKDYSLSFSEADLRTFPEGRKLLLDIRIDQRMIRRNRRFMGLLGEAMARRIDEPLREAFSQ